MKIITAPKTTLVMTFGGILTLGWCIVLEKTSVDDITGRPRKNEKLVVLKEYRKQTKI